MRRTRVAVNENVYKNRTGFDASIVSLIDTTVIYEEYNTKFYKNGFPVNMLARLNMENPYSYYEAYRFYNNGCYNLFILNRETDSALSSKTFNPDYAGYRGVYFKGKSNFKGNLITRVTGNGEIGTIKEIFQFVGDTLYIISGSPK